MKEDNYNEMEPNDEISKLITERLGARQEKLNKMDAWEKDTQKKSGMSRVYMRIVSFVVAACLVSIFVFFQIMRVTPTAVDNLGIDAPSLMEFRSASPDITEISRLMQQPDYKKALEVTEKALSHSDMEIKEMSDVVFGDDEEEVYEEEIERQMNAQLRWTYIYLLVKNGEKQTAIKQLKRYLKHRKYCENEIEAQKLLQELKK